MNRTLYLIALVSLTISTTGPTMAHSAALDVPESALDSRTVPHRDWVQVSGEIQQTMKVRPDGVHEQMVAMLQPVEGGRILIDLGPAAKLGSIKLQDKDYIHVRGTPLQQGETVMIVAGELIADGKLIPIEREEKPLPPAGMPSGPPMNQVKPHPAAPAAPAAPSH